MGATHESLYDMGWWVAPTLRRGRRDGSTQAASTSVTRGRRSRSPFTGGGCLMPETSLALRVNMGASPFFRADRRTRILKYGMCLHPRVFHPIIWNVLVRSSMLRCSARPSVLERRGIDHLLNGGRTAMTTRCGVDSNGLQGGKSSGGADVVANELGSSGFQRAPEARCHAGPNSRVGKAEIFLLGTNLYHFVPRIKDIARVRKPNLLLALVKKIPEAG